MRNFLDEICAVCKGEKYPRQCRNSEGWRAHKMELFGDIEELDFDCPYGVGLNFLPQTKEPPMRADGRRDHTGCAGCKGKMLRKMKARLQETWA